MASFKPDIMKEVHLYISQNDVEKVGNMLYDLKLMQFFTLEENRLHNFEAEDTSEIASKLLQLRSTITFLKPYYKSESTHVFENSITLTQELKKSSKTIKTELIHLQDELKRQTILGKLKVTPKQISSKEIVVGFISLDYIDNLKILKKSKILISNHTLGERVYFAAKTTKDISFSFKEFYLPKEIKLDLPLKIRALEKESKKIEIQLEELSNATLTNMQKKELQLSKKTALHQAKSSFKRTKNVALLSGHVPLKKAKSLKRSLEAELGDSFEIQFENAKEDAPTQLSHALSTGNFVSLLKMYSLPKYGEFDPTNLMFLIFPLFYGFVLGDFGYGLLSLILFSIVKRKKKDIKEFLTVLQYSSISSMIFGILYGEYFGFEPYHLFSRIHESETLLMIAIAFGFIHLNIGLVIGFFNEAKKSVKHAIYDKLSWVVLQIGIGLIAYGTYAVMSMMTMIGYGVLTLAVLLLYLGHGIMGIIEIPSFFTNALSYARLMAVGISSVVIALLVNEYSLLFMSKGIFGIIGGITLFTIGHIFNIVLGNFESFLHTLRLHYVEFFTKFYSGGGHEFEPFGKHIHDENKES